MNTKQSAFITYASDEHLFRCASAANEKPLPDEKITLAFGANNGPVLVKKLGHADAAVRRSALRAFCDQVKMPEFAVSFLAAGLIKALYDLVKDSDDVVRTLVSKAIGAATRAPNGTVKIVEYGVDGLKPLLNVGVKGVRSNTYKSLETICKSIKGNAALVASGYVPLLIQKSLTEDSEFQPVCTRILYSLLQCPGGAGLRAGLDESGVPASISLLKNDSQLVQENAAKCLSLLCNSIPPKGVAIKAGAVSILIDFLQSISDRVISAGACALMVLLTELPAKLEFIEKSGTEKLMELVFHSDRMVVMHSLKCISALSPHPGARKEMNIDSIVNRLKKLEYGTDSLMARTAKKTRELIQWVP